MSCKILALAVDVTRVDTSLIRVVNYSDVAVLASNRIFAGYRLTEPKAELQLSWIMKLIETNALRLRRLKAQ
jgi:hypothetical protein